MKTKNFKVDIYSSTEEKEVKLCLRVYDRNHHRYIYHEKISFDIAPKMEEFAATLDQCLFDPAYHKVIGNLQENRFHTLIWINCQIVNLITNEIVEKTKIPYSFKELYFYFKGQTETKWENEVSDKVYNH